jgi:type IV pilus assembly protein PilY1
MRMRLSMAAAVAASVLVPGTVWAQLIVKDDFTGATTQNTWKASNGACLTAGDGTGSVPACKGLAYYGGETLVGGATGSLPDKIGNGALRFTNGSPGGFNQNGAIVSMLNPAFSTKQGIQVTFTTETYLGNSGGGGGDGADGISFFLMDATRPAGIGAFGGSLGYSCSDSNPPYDGLVGGYIAVGIDEFGNFLNGGSTRSTTFPNNGPDNTASGWGYQPNRIGLRGAGNISWAWLNANYPTLYPSSLATTNSTTTVTYHGVQQLAPYSWLAVQDVCSTGLLSDYSTPTAPKRSSTSVMDYPAIPGAYTVLDPTVLQIANESATKRGDGTPITYKLKITTGGLLSFSYSVNGAAYLPVITGQDIRSSNGNLPDGLQFGFAGSTGGSTNIHEIMCFQATPDNQSASSVGLNQQQATKVQAGTQVYFAFYNPINWAGGVTANNFVDSAGVLAISTVANWDASCVLTGVPAGQTCQTTNGGAMNRMDPMTGRTILSFNDSTRAGVAFKFGNLSSNQQTALADTAASPDRLNYLRGDRTNEVTSANTGKFRARASVLGDILDSSPTWVGPPNAPYGTTWKDTLYPTATMPENAGPSYQSFATGPAQTRVNVVYTGANDGFLHGFRSGAFNADGTYNATLNDGTEVLAYMPGAIVNTIHNSTNKNLDFSDPHYGHNLYVDAAPGTGDVYYGGAWYTWLVGGLGGGGPALFALDVTDPSSNSFSESNAPAIVKTEWTPSGIGSCSASSGSSCADSMGDISGVPQIRRFHSGNWGAVVGNGLKSASGDAGIFVMLLDKSTGKPSLYYVSATHNTTTNKGKNGIVFATAADLDGDHITDYVYAGDVKGNIWRFDLTSSDPTQWAAGAAALYTTSAGQPITTKVVVVSVPSTTGPPRVMVEFGTGKQTPLTITKPTAYASGSQSLYGIWDWNMAAWNLKPSIKYASAASLKAGASLVTQTISLLATGFRGVTNTPVCWQDVSSCAATPQYGWTESLPDTSTSTTSSNTTTVNNEQVIFNPILELGAFIVNTTVPAVTSPTTCTVSSSTGWTMALNPENGGAFPTSFFSDPQGKFVTINNQTIEGVAWNGTGSPAIVIIGDPPPGDPNLAGTYLATQTSGGGGRDGKINPPAGTKGGRLTWIERR